MKMSLGKYTRVGYTVGKRWFAVKLLSLSFRPPISIDLPKILGGPWEWLFTSVEFPTTRYFCFLFLWTKHPPPNWYKVLTVILHLHQLWSQSLLKSQWYNKTKVYLRFCSVKKAGSSVPYGNHMEAHPLFPEGSSWWRLLLSFDTTVSTWVYSVQTQGTDMEKHTSLKFVL